MSKTQIAVLGGGYGGIEAAKTLHKKLKKDPNVEITLIDKNPYHTLMTELHEVAGSRVDPDAVKISYERIFSGKKVNVVTDTINDIDFQNRKLKSDYTSYDYDYLVIGAGGEPEFFDIPGVQENSFTIWSLEEAIRLRDHIEDRFRYAAAEPDDEKRKQMLTFVIAGAGFTGIELAGELLERKKTLCRDYHIKEDDVRVIIAEAMSNILPILPEKLQKKAERFLKKKGAEVMVDSPITGAEEGKVKIGETQEIATDTFVWTCGIHGSEFSSKVDLTMGATARGKCSFASSQGIHGMAGCKFDDDERYTVGERGRILVDEEMKSVDHENVYVVGDILWYLHSEKVVPQIVETALQSGEVAAKNIVADIKKKEKEKFEPSYHGFMISIGSKYAVAHVVGISLVSIFAMATKHLINLHYLFGVAGLNAVWGYLKHEFFDMKENRSMVSGHLSAKIPVYWTVPLRIFIGVKWLIEGVKKISDGWLNPDNIYIIADAASSASPADGGGGEWEGAEALLSQPIALYQWFADTFISQAPFFFQATVVIAEIVIGLALIGGLFTFLASLATIGLGVMFIVSAMGGAEIFWYIAAAIVMLGGAGKGFGLDHWVMPWIKRWWNGTKLAKATYFYLDEPRLKK